jgi:hypothetical protein
MNRRLLTTRVERLKEARMLGFRHDFDPLRDERRDFMHAHEAAALVGHRRERCGDEHHDAENVENETEFHGDTPWRAGTVTGPG